MPESIEFNPDFARRDKPVVVTKVLQIPTKDNDLIGLLNDFKNFVSMVFVGTASYTKQRNDIKTIIYTMSVCYIKK